MCLMLFRVPLALFQYALTYATYDSLLNGMNITDERNESIMPESNIEEMHLVIEQLIMLMLYLRIRTFMQTKTGPGRVCASNRRLLFI